MLNETLRWSQMYACCKYFNGHSFWQKNVSLQCKSFPWQFRRQREYLNIARAEFFMLKDVKADKISPQVKTTFVVGDIVQNTANATVFVLYKSYTFKHSNNVLKLFSIQTSIPNFIYPVLFTLYYFKVHTSICCVYYHNISKTFTTHASQPRCK